MEQPRDRSKHYVARMRQPIFRCRLNERFTFFSVCLRVHCKSSLRSVAMPPEAPANTTNLPPTRYRSDKSLVRAGWPSSAHSRCVLLQRYKLRQ